MHDVAIVGAGPGGLFAAKLLAARGFRVAVFEEHAVSGVPVHCTGVLAADAFAEFGIDSGAVLNPLQRVRFVPPGGRCIEYTSPDVQAVAIDRLRFDQQLEAAALSAGATLITEHRVVDVSAGDQRAVLHLGDGREVAARVCVLACGANYSLQRRIGFGLPLLHLQSAQVEIAARDPGDVEVYFGRAVAPRGFAWAVPVRRESGWYARVGLMCDADAGAHFDRFVSTIADRWGLDRDGVRPRRKMLPLAPVGRTYGHRVLAIGDAGGIVKATTGGGIYYSLVTARIASAVLDDALRANTLDAASLRTYEARWRAALGPELDAQLELRQLAHELDDADIDAFFELAHTNGIMPLLRQTARFNQHRQLIGALLRHPPARRILVKRFTAATSLLDAVRDRTS
jgi:geranylgeranyl reductase family protein